MFRLGMLLGCIFASNAPAPASGAASPRPSPDDFATNEIHGLPPDRGDLDGYAVTCYICVNVSDNVVCNKFAIDSPCKPGETFCHTLHIMDSKGTSVLVNKKCTTSKECQRNKVGCVEVDTQMMCVSCCDQNYCNVNVPTNSSTATYDDKITKMRMNAKILWGLKEKTLTSTKKEATSTACNICCSKIYLLFSFLYVFINT